MRQITVQIGGYGMRDYPLFSRRACPYERSFTIQGDKVVVMGWPIRRQPFQKRPTTLPSFAQEARLYPLTLDVVISTWLSQLAWIGG